MLKTNYLACDWLSIVWAYSKQETENGPRTGIANLVNPVSFPLVIHDRIQASTSESSTLRTE